ncbi:sensor histidine kinase [Actibacterium pelagium]|uniref:histidine kinase n=1 Tax=Actibacterium pelagium TaxID=2029103 RepID=A0A917EGF2_9RHOB|nr:ATP-binding protein [Actibacterium pelagium]GGE37889.1 two-component sensor histidine kinase [Actibacterium pelagium]
MKLDPAITKDLQTPEIDVPDRIRPGIVVVLLVTVILTTVATYFGALRLFENQAVSVAQSQHSLYLRSLNEAIKQHQHLPFVLSQNPLLAEQVARGEERGLNETLKKFADASRLEAIYVMTLDGQVFAASNFDSPDSFLGNNYGFRPYFQRAVAGERSDYFAIGATTGRPGYFVAEPLRSVSGGLVGVVAIKLDISELQFSWEERGEYVLATNSDGVVLLSSNPDWLFRTISPLDDSRKTEIVNSRQFGTEPLESLTWEASGDSRINLDGQSFLRTAGQTEFLDWTVHYLTPEAMIQRQTLGATVLLGSLIAVLIGFAAFLRSQRIAAAFLVSQRRGEELAAANQRLLEAKDELERTSKLAALGQLAASVTHELGQPISALKNHLLAAEIGNEITSPETLYNFKRLIERMEAITKQLRFFSQGNRDEKRPIDMKTVFKGTLALLQHDLDAAHMTVSWTPSETPCVVEADQFQLEQAMVNLLRNAMHASSGTGANSIVLNCDKQGDNVLIHVTDSGSGLNGMTLEQLQEPFFSTKSSGVGMGLGLAITAEIIRAHGGTLSAQDCAGGGARFTISLPAARKGLS